MNLSTTTILIALNVAASMYAWKNQNIYQKWMMNPYQVHTKREYYRFLTSGFIHVDTMHLLFNMLMLYFFGDYAEGILFMVAGNAGTLVYVLFYVVGIIISELPTYFKHRNHPQYNSLGASGAVSAVLFLFILFYPLEKLYLFGMVPIPGFLLGIFYILYSIQMGKRKMDNINHDAHLYGALYGIIFGIVSYPEVIYLFVQQISEFSIF